MWKKVIIKVSWGKSGVTWKSLNQSFHYTQWPIITREETKTLNKGKQYNRQFSAKSPNQYHTFSHLKNIAIINVEEKEEKKSGNEWKRKNMFGISEKGENKIQAVYISLIEPNTI
jgi:hypothetical protein